ncbi:MAG: hypothetical protein HUJ93_01390 [Bacteroidales bacterium]|nr:hypothetical protein [Bacteroidales bacterium]
MAGKGYLSDDPRQSRAGLYTTLIFHFSILIVLLATSLGAAVKPETTFILDFSKQEQKEKEIEIEERKEEISKQLEELIAQKAAENRKEIRNVAVNTERRMERNFKKDAVYDEDKELQKRLDAAKAKNEAIDQADAENYAALNAKKEGNEDQAPAYQGPSVISYTLDGRNAKYLPVPAYKGYGSGDVAVKITVNQKGRVTKAEVITKASCSDPQLHQFAIAAAMRSTFSSSTTAPNPQTGEILYRFISQ